MSGRPRVDLEPYKAEIIGLYENKMKSDDICKHMKRQHDIQISARTLTKRLQLWGVKEKMENNSSNEALHARIKNLFFDVGLTDQEIVTVLHDEGYDVSARTLRRLRHQLGIRLRLDSPTQQQAQLQEILDALTEEMDKGTIEGYGKELLHNHFRSKDIAEGARRVLNHIENNGTEDRYVTGYIRAVRQYALNAQRGDSQGMAKVLEALTKINADTERLNQRIDTIERTTSALSTNLSTPAADPAAAWRNFRAKDWQRDLAKAAAPNTRSNGTSSPGVPEIELHPRTLTEGTGGAGRKTEDNGCPTEELWRPIWRGYLRGSPETAFGDVTMVANSAAGAELLRKHTGWLKAFGPGSVVQEPSWGVVAYHIPVKSMKITPETMADVATDLLRQNDWSEGARIQYLGWLTRPGVRAESSLLIEFTNPVVANRAIITGVAWGKQIHNAVRFCREGRTKLCRKCQKPGHIQSHCSNVFKCGHCADGHATWECPSTRGQAIPVKCANCGGGHRPVSRDCPVKIAALKEAKQALADCPTYHRIPLHFHSTSNRDEVVPQARQDPVERDTLEASIHAREKPQDIERPQSSTPSVIDLELEPARMEAGTEGALQEPAEPTKPRKGPGRPKGSRTRPKEQLPPSAMVASQRAAWESRRTPWTNNRMIATGSTFNLHRAPSPQDILQRDNLEDELTQFTYDVTTINDIEITPEPGLEDLDPESPEYQKLITLKYNRQRARPAGSSPPIIMTDVPTVEDPNDEVWHETSERTDDEQHH
ncbi:hypothetical protein N7497_001130 [Penicillium chrysogenum]|nr:hypothetical protein N7497_001130 [Penicillium chrysogenum]